MGYPELSHDEPIILESRNVKYKSISFDAILTNKRIYLTDSRKNDIFSENITLETIGNVGTEENDMRDHFLILSLVTDAGEKHQAVLTFARQAGVERKRECNAWAKKLKSLIPPSIPVIAPSDVPELDREPLTISEILTKAQGAATSTGPIKKKIEINRPLETIIEKSPVASESVETTSLPSGSFCSRCGNRVLLKSTFCNNCWTPIKQPSGLGQKSRPVIFEAEVSVPPRQTKPVVPKEQEIVQPPTPQPIECKTQFLDRSPCNGNKRAGILNKRVIAVIFIGIILSIAGIILLTFTPESSVSPPTPSVSPPPPSVSPTPVSTLHLEDFGIKGDGTDETAQLQSAFTYARDHSIKTVVFPSNKVIMISDLIQFYENTRVYGNGSTLKRTDGMGAHAGQMISVHDGCHVSGLIYDGNSATIQGAGDGIRLHSNVIFDGNEVKNVREYSVVVYDASNVRITNNYIHDSWQYGICTGGSDGPGSWGYNITVSGNTISDCNEVGIKIRGTSGATITNNTISVPSVTTDSGYGLLSRGISLYSFDEPNEHIVINGNYITGVVGSGDTAGISSDDNNNTDITITNNYVTTCDKGIDIQFNNGIITGNTVSNCGKSIQNAGSGNTVVNNILTNNSESNNLFFIG